MRLFQKKKETLVTNIWSEMLPRCSVRLHPPALQLLCFLERNKTKREVDRQLILMGKFLNF